MKAFDLSTYIISYSDAKGDLVTNKKLQKLMYYVEAWNLVHLDSLISEDFQAWVHGPVVPEVYHQYKNFVYSPVIIDYNGKHASHFNDAIAEQNDVKDDKRELIDTVIYKYGALSSFQLEMLSHSEKPWLVARKGLEPTQPSDAVIDKQLMREFYKSLLDK